ncbi:MAG: SDR family oxidoreductase [Actinobacteria bacterium]|nr:SDR family oxidoreductase [Actinomycetota bacterium]
MGKWALVTGATAGIGYEFAKLLASENHNLVLVARDKTRLKSIAKDLKSQYGIKCEVLVADLTKKKSLEEVATRISKSGKRIEVLINNAGFSVNQSISNGDYQAEKSMLDVLVTAVLRLSHAAAAQMRVNGGGDILIVSSVASFMTGGTYSSAKAWATNFAESLASEVNKYGVNVSALCPGFTHTEFHARANFDKSEVPNWMWLDADYVVRKGWKDHKQGKVISIPSLRYKFFVVMMKITPSSLIRKVQRKK